jgi:hypothetical protein
MFRMFVQRHIFWVSDGGHIVHVMSAVETESPNGDNGDVIGERELAPIKLSGCGIPLALQSYILSLKYLNLSINYKLT